MEEGERDQNVEGPVDSGCTRVARAPGPQWVDLRIDRPRHGAHSLSEETSYSASENYSLPFYYFFHSRIQMKLEKKCCEVNAII